MKFKHSFHVFVDNFSVTYKQLLYRLVILLVTGGIAYGALYPFVTDFINSPALNSLTENIRAFISNFLNGDVANLSGISAAIQQAFGQVKELLQTKITEIVLMGLLLLLFYLIEKWFAGLGNYTTAVLLNDKMALRAKSPFLGTLISHLKEAAIYNLIYVPLSILYDLLVIAALVGTLYYMLINIQFLLISLFIFTLMVVLAISLKMTFTCDWLPALIRGKMGQKGALKFTFSRRGKDTLNVFSNFVVLILIILALNVMAALFTFGVGILLTVPASYVMLISFEMVTYYDREELRYFIDKNTVIKPDKERTLTREQFFNGTGEDD